MEEKNMEIKITDRYGDNLSDSCFTRKKAKDVDDRPKGFVEIYEVDNNGNKQLVGKNNLVVYMGREWLVSRAFNKTNSFITPKPAEFITWFGVGDGGCPIADPMNPTSPANTNTDLSNSVMINSLDAHCADYRDPDPEHPEYKGYYKHPFDEVSFEQDTDNYNHWLIMKITTTLGGSDANTFYVNEAGLFTAENEMGGSTGPFHLYARVTFPSIMKTNARQLMFVWYVFF